MITKLREKLKPALIGYLILAGFGVYGTYRVESLAKDLNTQTRSDCVDRSGDTAFRHQDEKIVQIILNLNSRKITPQKAQKQFVETYTEALKEAGPVPSCIVTR